MHTLRCYTRYAAPDASTSANNRIQVYLELEPISQNACPGGVHRYYLEVESAKEDYQVRCLLDV